MSCVISNAQARTIASNWHGGQSSALYSLAFSGAVDLDRMRHEISQELQQLDLGEVRRPLLALDKYLSNREDRNPVAEWAGLWDETPVNIDQC